jgi:putative ABC transport system permease protein
MNWLTENEAGRLGMRHYLQTLHKDLGYSLRVLRRSPGFAAAAVLSLALGIGTNTAIFSVADAFLLKPLPYMDARDLTVITEMAPKQDDFSNNVAPANFLDWQNQSTSFQAMAASEWMDMNLTGAGEPDRVQGFLVSANFFRALGVDPALGRGFLADEDQSGRDNVAILSHGLWERRFGSDPGMVGKDVELDGKKYAVVGIMPRDFDFPMTAEVWTPLVMDGKERAIRTRHYLDIVGRLKPGVTISQAGAEMQTISERLEAAYPDTNKGWRTRVMPIRDYVLSDLTRQYTLMLMAAVMFVLLIACANVANLQYARSAGREKEIALRQALGAGRWRLVRQLLTESLVLGVIGAVISLPLAKVCIDLILAGMPPEVAKFIPGWKAIGLDARALGFTMGVAIFAGVISGLAPSLRGSRSSLNEALKEGGRSSSAGSARQRVRAGLVVGEVALALILLVGAGLMTTGFRALVTANLSLNPESVLTMRISLPESKYKEASTIASFYEQSLNGMNTIPGVQGAAVVTSVPYGNGGSSREFTIQDHPPVDPSVRSIARLQVVSPNYFQLMHVALLRGREFNDLDGPDSMQVAIISENMARRYWPGEDPLGKRLKVVEPGSNKPWMTVVGIAQDVKYEWFNKEVEPALYLAYRQAPLPYSYFALRTTGDPIKVAAAVRSKVASVDPVQPLYDIRTLERVITNSVLGLAYVAVMMGILGGVALFLSSVGVYGLISYSVTERTHEIGLRMALGARQVEVLRMVVGRGLLLTVSGLVIGLPISVLLARLLSSLVFGVSATDMMTFGGVSLVLTSVAMLASYIPAHRATRVDPMVALRCE